MGLWEEVNIDDEPEQPDVEMTQVRAFHDDEGQLATVGSPKLQPGRDQYGRKIQVRRKSTLESIEEYLYQNHNLVGKCAKAFNAFMATTFGVILLHRLTPVVEFSLALIVHLCTEEQFGSAMCGGGGILHENAGASGLFLAAPAACYILLWRSASRFWAPKISDKVNGSVLQSGFSWISSAFELNWFVSKKGNNSLTGKGDEDSNILASLLWCFTLPMFPVLDAYIFIKYLFVDVGGNFLAYYDRSRNVVFAFGNSPMQLVAMLYFLDARLKSGKPWPALLVPVILFALLNIITQLFFLQDLVKSHSMTRMEVLSALLEMSAPNRKNVPFRLLLRARRMVDYRYSKKLTEEHVEQISRALVDNQRLQVLRFGHVNGLTTAEGEVIGKALVNNRSVKSLNGVNLKDIRKAATVGLSFDRIKYGEIPSQDAEGLTCYDLFCPMLAKERELPAALGDFEAVAVASILVFNSNLRVLDLSANLIGDAGFDWMSSFLTLCTNVQYLNLSRNRASPAAAGRLLDDLCDHPSLEVLAISEVSGVELPLGIFRDSSDPNVDLSSRQVLRLALERFARAIDVQAQSVGLVFHGVDWPLEHCEAVLQKFINERFVLARDWELTIPVEARSLTLRWVLARLGHPFADWPGRLDGVHCKEESVTHGVARHLLTDLGLGVATKGMLVHEKRNLATANSFLLSSSKLTHYDGLCIARFLRTNLTISSLVLSENGLGDHGMAPILDWATTSTTLSILDLRDNKVLLEGRKNQEATRPASVEALINLVRKAIKVERLDVSSNPGLFGFERDVKEELRERVTRDNYKLSIKLY